MGDISRTALFGKLNSVAYKAIEGATVFCKLRGNPYVELVHWIQQILQTPDSDLHRIVRHFELDSSRLAKDATDAPAAALQSEVPAPSVEVSAPAEPHDAHADHEHADHEHAHDDHAHDDQPHEHHAHDEHAEHAHELAEALADRDLARAVPGGVGRDVDHDHAGLGSVRHRLIDPVLAVV